MSTILRINKKTKAAKLFLEYVKTLSFVSVEEEDAVYDPKFVEKIKNSDKNDKRIRIHSENIWESIS